MALSWSIPESASPAFLFIVVILYSEPFVQYFLIFRTAYDEHPSQVFIVGLSECKLKYKSWLNSKNTQDTLDSLRNWRAKEDCVRRNRRWHMIV